MRSRCLATLIQAIGREREPDSLARIKRALAEPFPAGANGCGGVMTEMSIRQRIVLAEFLATHFAKVRANILNPEAVEEMTIGERLAAKFGGQVAAWVSLPNPAKRASVTNKAAFLAWVEKYLPAEVETVKVVRSGHPGGTACRREGERRQVAEHRDRRVRRDSRRHGRDG